MGQAGSRSYKAAEAAAKAATPAALQAEPGSAVARDAQRGACGPAAATAARCCGTRPRDNRRADPACSHLLNNPPTIPQLRSTSASS